MTGSFLLGTLLIAVGGLAAARPRTVARFDEPVDATGDRERAELGLALTKFVGVGAAGGGAAAVTVAVGSVV